MCSRPRRWKIRRPRPICSSPLWAGSAFCFAIATRSSPRNVSWLSAGMKEWRRRGGPGCGRCASASAPQPSRRTSRRDRSAKSISTECCGDAPRAGRDRLGRAMGSGVQYLVGTASWTDPTLVKSDLFYPPPLRTAEDRLRVYASQSNGVEVHSTYSGLLGGNARRGAERTPRGLVFDIKAYAMLTHHGAEVSRMPNDLRAMLTEGQR